MGELRTTGTCTATQPHSSRPAPLAADGEHVRRRETLIAYIPDRSLGWNSMEAWNKGFRWARTRVPSPRLLSAVVLSVTAPLA